MRVEFEITSESATILASITRSEISVVQIAPSPSQRRKVRNGPRPANRSSLAALPGAFGPSSCLSRRPQARAKLRCACRAASGVPANSMALGAPHRRRRCSRPSLTTNIHAHVRRAAVSMSGSGNLSQ